MALAPMSMISRHGGKLISRAAHFGHTDMLDALIQVGGVDVDTPLSRAAAVGHVEALHVVGSVEGVKALLHARANPNVGDNNGFTPLHYASFYGNIQIIRALLQGRRRKGEELFPKNDPI